MKNKVLTAAILLAVTSTAAHAVSINMRHEWSPSWENKDDVHKDRIAVSHRFANGIGFAVETKWESGNKAFDFDQFVDSGNSADISYSWKFADDFTLTPQYKWETSGKFTGKNDVDGDAKHAHQFNLTLGYKINSDWSASFRHRYHYEINTLRNKDNSHYNRWSLGLGYKGIENWNLSGSADYTFRQEGVDQWKGDNYGFSEFNAKAEYKWGGGWYPFAEFGVTPQKKEGSDYRDAWQPRYRVGMKYSF